MTTLQVQLSDSTYEFLAEQAQTQGFTSASEYLAALAAEAEASREAIEDALIQGLESGPAREMTRQDWDSLKQRLRERNEAESGP
jgi:Arc/MetJ-type ribon-helix-helix transcriptional regulator